MKKSRLSSGRCRRVALSVKVTFSIEAAARLKSQSKSPNGYLWRFLLGATSPAIALRSFDASR